jgi:hypothetical protein
VRRRGSKSATQDWGCTDGDAQRLLISLRAEGERTSYTTLTLPRRPTASTWTWRPARLWIVTEQKRGSEAEAEACLMKRQKGWGQGAFLACPAETNLKAENSRREPLIGCGSMFLCLACDSGGTATDTKNTRLPRYHYG